MPIQANQRMICRKRVNQSSYIMLHDATCTSINQFGYGLNTPKLNIIHSKTVKKDTGLTVSVYHQQLRAAPSRPSHIFLGVHLHRSQTRLVDERVVTTTLEVPI